MLASEDGVTVPNLCLVECTNPISLEMAMAASRQIAEVRQSQGSEEQQEPDMPKFECEGVDRESGDVKTVQEHVAE